MKVGLDLDNTLICYDDVFVTEAKNLGFLSLGWSGGKKDVKKTLSALHDGDRKWQILQGRVYGPRMCRARLFPGIALFLMRCKARGHQVFIVSHKTEFGHFDHTRTRLREAATDWMTERGFFNPCTYSIPRKNLFFLSTRVEKLQQIARLDLDVFVDDLEEVLLDEQFPAIKKILFGSPSAEHRFISSSESWMDIGYELFGAVTDQEYLEILQSTCDQKVIEIARASRGANSEVFCVTTDAGRKFAAKFYPDLNTDSRPRLQREVAACNLLQHLNFTPKVVSCQEDLNLGLFEWIEGKKPDLSSPKAIESALDFVKSLKSLYDTSDRRFPESSEACLSTEDLTAQIETRLLVLERIEHQQLQHFLRQHLRPLWNEILSVHRQQISKDAARESLPLDKQTLSPSDFGFHNAIEQEEKKIMFYDLEYFGRDDPVKLIADFLWHPGMNLTPTNKERWTQGALEIFIDDINLVSRLRTTWGYYGVRWALIILNRFRLFGISESTRQPGELLSEKFAEEQLKKAEEVYLLLKEHRLECPYV
jgi:hypothetical protein